MLRLLSVAFLFAFTSLAFAAAPPAEQKKIDALLDSFTPDVVFIRNGEEHDGAWARQHLSEKLANAKGVNTAKDFIEKIATKSSHTGQAYQVRLADGKTVDCAMWLKAKLKGIEVSQAGPKQ